MYRSFPLLPFFLSILTLVWCLTAATPLYAQEVNRGLTLGPGLMTYEEIAMALSTPQSPVSCADSVKNRAAFLYLNNRPRENALELLSKALDVEFRKADAARSDSPLVLTSDPEVARRERTWRLRFANNLQRLYSLKVQEMQRYSGWSKEQLDAEYQQIQDLLKKQSQKGAEDSELWKLSRRIEGFSSVYSIAGSRPETPLVNFWMANKQGLFSANRLIDQGQMTFVDTLESIPPPVLAPLLESLAPQGEPNANNKPVFDSLAVRYYLSRPARRLTIGGDLTLSSSVSTLKHEINLKPRIHIAAHNQIGKLTEVVFQGGRAEGGFPISGLGEAAMAWFDAEEKDTALFRSSEIARAPLKEKIGPVDSLSQWLSEWQRQTRREVIMELWPQYEWVDFDWYKKLEANLVSLSEQFPNWTMKFDNEVLIAKNRMAFLDRLPERPTAALVKLLQNTLRREETETKASLNPSQPAGISSDSLQRRKPSFGDRLNYAAAAVTYAPWKPAETTIYWGINLGDRDGAVPVFYIWSQLTTEQREAWQKERYLSLSVLSAAKFQTQRAFLQYFQPNLALYGIPDVFLNPQGRLPYPFGRENTTLP